MIKCELELGNLTPKCQLYNVLFEGETLVKGARDPESSACRVLKDRGYTGEVGFFSVGSQILRLFVRDLGVYAQNTVTEENKAGLRTAPYVSFSKTRI